MKHVAIEERRADIRHGDKPMQGVVRVAWFAASHVPPFVAADVTANVCVKVPEPQLDEQLPLVHWPTQFTAENNETKNILKNRKTFLEGKEQARTRQCNKKGKKSTYKPKIQAASRRISAV